MGLYDLEVVSLWRRYFQTGRLAYDIPGGSRVLLLWQPLDTRFTDNTSGKALS